MNTFSPSHTITTDQFFNHECEHYYELGEQVDCVKVTCFHLVMVNKVGKLQYIRLQDCEAN